MSRKAIHIAIALSLAGGLGAAALAQGAPSLFEPVQRGGTNGASQQLMQSGRMAGQTAPAATTSLPPLDLSGMRLWNYNAKWHASEWANAGGPIPWKADHVKPQPNGDVHLILDSAGAPQLQAVKGMTGYTSGLWETEVTLPQMQDGLIVAPLWLYHSGSKDEIDFEFAGTKGLDVSMHAYPGGVHKQKTVRLFPGQDMSGQRKRFGIRLDLQQGFADMYVDGQMVHRFDRTELGFFVSNPLKPFIEMWATDPNNAGFVSWTGGWKGLQPGERKVMVVHGYAHSD